MEKKLKSNLKSIFGCKILELNKILVPQNDNSATSIQNCNHKISIARSLKTAPLFNCHRQLVFIFHSYVNVYWFPIVYAKS